MTWKNEYPHLLTEHLKRAILTAMGAGDYAMARRLAEITKSYKGNQYAWINYETHEVKIARTISKEEVLNGGANEKEKAKEESEHEKSWRRLDVEADRGHGAGSGSL